MTSTRVRNWCFTLNNYTEEDKEILKTCTCKYLIYGEEVGASGTPHLQGYIEFDVSMRLGSLKKLLPRAHWEARKKPRGANINYCKKDGKFFERNGEPLPIEKNEKNRLTYGGHSVGWLWDGNKISNIERRMLIPLSCEHYSGPQDFVDWGVDQLSYEPIRTMEMKLEGLNPRGMMWRGPEDHLDRWFQQKDAYNRFAADLGLCSIDELLGWKL